MAGSLGSEFLAALDDDQRAESGALPELDDALAAALRSARERWPEVAIDGGAFVRYLAARAAGNDLAGLHTDDLYLACGCAGRDPAAIAAFEAEYGRDIDAVAARFRRAGLDLEDIGQQVREKILVAPAGETPKIGDYSGLGFLQNWVRITAVRTFLDATRRAPGRREVGDAGGLMMVADPDDDVELAYLKRHYRAAFKTAFEQAIASLTSQQRNALRQHLVAGLTIDQIAGLYGIHRSTAARRVAAAREALLSATRGRLADQLAVDDGELGSIMRLIASQLDVSIVRVLQARSRTE